MKGICGQGSSKGADMEARNNFNVRAWATTVRGCVGQEWKEEVHGFNVVWEPPAKS